MAETVIPGGSVTLHLQVVTRTEGPPGEWSEVAADLTGATVTTEVAAAGVNSEVAASVTDVNNTTKKILVSGAQTRARAGKKVRVRAWVAFPSTLEDVPAEFSVIVGA